MSRTLTVSGTPYEYPDVGEAAGWGEASTLWAQAVTDVLGTLSGSDDILLTSFTVANNQSSAANVTGLSFSTSTVRGADISYTIIRTSSTTTTGAAEKGEMQIIYDAGAATNSKWQLIQDRVGDAGVTFTITDAGQLQYTSTDIGSTSYSGTMKFTATTKPQ